MSPHPWTTSPLQAQPQNAPRWPYDALSRIQLPPPGLGVSSFCVSLRAARRSSACVQGPIGMVVHGRAWPTLVEPLSGQIDLDPNLPPEDERAVNKFL